MRYIDRTGCKSMHDSGRDLEITKLGKLTRKATKIAEDRHLGLLKTRWGVYRIIRECGLGAGIDEDFNDLAEVDSFLRSI